MESLLFSSALGPSSLSTGERVWRGQASFKNKLNACSSALSISGSYGQVGGSNTLNIHKKYASLLYCADYHPHSVEQRPALHLALASAASQPPLEPKPEAYKPNSTCNSVKDGLIALCHFIRPYATTGTVITVTSVSLLAVERLSDLSPPFFTGLLQAVILVALMHIFVGGVNQLTDINIDKVNKPYLPLASGKFSPGTAVMIVAFALIMSSCIGIIAGSRPLLWAILSGFVFGIGYSINLPLLRWKKSAAAAAISIPAYHAVALPIIYFLHIQTHVLGRPAHFPCSLVFTVAFMSIFCMVIALFKDIPDMDGDKKYGVQSLTTHLGQKRVFWICISILLMDYVGAILVGSFSSSLLTKVITISGHVVLASTLLARAKSTDLKSKAALQSFYMFIWQLHNAEYLLIPFLR